MASLAAADVIKIDLSPENGRHNALAPGMLDWRYKPAGDVAEFDAGSGVSVRLENAGTLKPTMWKGGYGYRSPMASDGVDVGGEGIRDDRRPAGRKAFRRDVSQRGREGSGAVHGVGRRRKQHQLNQ